jgi:hypothetical protein
MQQPAEVAYIPKTPAWVHGPATAGGGATVRKGAGGPEAPRHAASRLQSVYRLFMGVARTLEEAPRGAHRFAARACAGSGAAGGCGTVADHALTRGEG